MRVGTDTTEPISNASPSRVWRCAPCTELPPDSRSALTRCLANSTPVSDGGRPLPPLLAAGASGLPFVPRTDGGRELVKLAAAPPDSATLRRRVIAGFEIMPIRGQSQSDETGRHTSSTDLMYVFVFTNSSVEHVDCQKEGLRSMGVTCMSKAVVVPCT